MILRSNLLTSVYKVISKVLVAELDGGGVLSVSEFPSSR